MQFKTESLTQRTRRTQRNWKNTFRKTSHETLSEMSVDAVGLRASPLRPLRENSSVWIGVSADSEMELPRQGAKSAKLTFWQENFLGGTSSSPHHPHLGSFVLLRG
jgi:hypothetical protein